MSTYSFLTGAGGGDVVDADLDSFFILRRQWRRENSHNRIFLISLLLSVAFVTSGFLTWHYLSRRSEREHVFILLDAGEEAMEVQLGAFADIAPSHPRVNREISETRIDPLPPIVPPEEKRLVEPESDPDPLEELVREEDHRVQPEPLDLVKNEPPPRSTPQRVERVVLVPEIKDLSPSKSTASPPESGLVKVRHTTGELRFGEDLPEQNAISEERNRSIFDPEKAELPQPIPNSPDIEIVNLDESKPERMPERKRRRRKRETEKPDVREQASTAAPAAPAMVSGGSAKPRGVRQRATPAGGFAIVYPISARQSGESGTTVVQASIRDDGTCQTAVVKHSSGFPILDQVALDAVRHALYQPATIDGESISAEETFEIIFELVERVY